MYLEEDKGWNAELPFMTHLTHVTPHHIIYSEWCHPFCFSMGSLHHFICLSFQTALASWCSPLPSAELWLLYENDLSRQNHVQSKQPLSSVWKYIGLNWVCVKLESWRKSVSSYTKFASYTGNYQFRLKWTNATSKWKCLSCLSPAFEEECKWYLVTDSH